MAKNPTAPAAPTQQQRACIVCGQQILEALLSGRCAACESAASVRTDRRIDRYRLELILGEGASGIVYRATDTTLKRTVALKVPRLLSTDPRIQQQFLNEARAVARLRHPNIAMVYDSGNDNGTVYIVSEFVNGHSIQHVVSNDRPSLRKAVIWVRDIARALQYAHERGIVHRDIKPANILITEEGRAVLTDFGLARREETAGIISADGTIPGTPAYMSPEQARGESRIAGPLSDQYSLGVVLYELLTGQVPFSGPVLKVLAEVAEKQPTAPSRIRSDVPQELSRLCLKMLDKQPDSRFDSLGTVENLLNEWLAEGRIPAFTSLLRRQTRIAILTAAVLIVPAVAMLVWSGGTLTVLSDQGTLSIQTELNAFAAGATVEVQVEVRQNNELIHILDAGETSSPEDRRILLQAGEYTLQISPAGGPYSLSADRIHIWPKQTTSVRILADARPIKVPVRPAPPPTSAVPAPAAPIDPNVSQNTSKAEAAPALPVAEPE